MFFIFCYICMCKITSLLQIMKKSRRRTAFSGVWLLCLCGIFVCKMARDVSFSSSHAHFTVVRSTAAAAKEYDKCDYNNPSAIIVKEVAKTVIHNVLSSIFFEGFLPFPYHTMRTLLFCEEYYCANTEKSVTTKPGTLSRLKYDL